MSHQIENDDTMFSVKEVPWHGLGTILEDPPSSEEAIRLANLDWEVELHDLYAHLPSGGTSKVPGQYATVRMSDNKVLGTVGSRYTPLQNARAFSFFDPVVEKGVAHYETAGSLLGGKKVWILAKLEGDLSVGDDDTVKKYVLLSNSHDGSSTVIVKTTAVRVVCNNTLSAALWTKSAKGDEFSIRHTKSVEDRTEKAFEMMKSINERFDALQKIWKAMTEFQMPDHQKIRYVQEVFPISEAAKRTTRKVKKQAEVLQLAANGMGSHLSTAEDTLWGMYNGITQMVTHDISERKGNTEDKHVDSLWSGRLADVNNRAFKVATDFLKEAGVSIAA